MDASLKAAELVVPPDVTERSLLEEEETTAAACASFDPMDQFRTRLEEIVSSYSKVPAVPEQQSWVEAEMEKKKESEDQSVTMETEMSLIMQSLSQVSSPEEKLQEMVKKYAEMASLRRGDEQKLRLLQLKFSRLLDERQQLQKEQRSNLTARNKLETLCKDLQLEYDALREDTIERCREDERKRNEMTAHFQEMLTEIQTQIEQHNARNDKLCRENNNLTEKLESLMNQCELREESLEKINKHRDLQQKLTEARLAQANALLVEAEDKHKREKEYLLREAIDKTKKCFAMKEQELSMKKKLLVQAAEWKLQTQTLREQGTVMQTQLALYAQKFDEFQGTLAKSNEIFHRFKKEMDTMSDKMKKMEKESNLWKTRFENCNKALTDMLEERTEKGKEYDVFVLKIQKLEKLCRALQDERKVLYDKIKDVRQSNLSIPSKVFGLPPTEPADKAVPLSSEDLETLQNQDPALTQDMARLKEEQAKLQIFAESLFSTEDVDEEITEIDLEEDIVSSAFSHFKTKKEAVEVEPEVKQEEKKEEVEVESLSKDEQKAEQTEDQTDKQQTEKCEESTAQLEKTDDTVEEKQVSEEPPVIETPPEVKTEPEKSSLDEAKAEVSEVVEVKAEEKPEVETATKPESENCSDSSKKQAPKKKKKRNNKNAS